MSIEALTNLISGLIAVGLTLLVFSRLLGDNPAFRAVQYLFVGASLGYAFVVVYHQVLRPGAVTLISSGSNPTLFGLRLIPWLLGLLLLTRLTRRQAVSWLANIPLALLFGVGMALAAGGALAGTIVPQLLDTARPPGADPLQALGAAMLVIGVVLTLGSFYFTAPRGGAGGRLLVLSARAGRWLLMVAFGFFLAGVLLTYLTALNARLEFIVNWLRAPFG
ncbi:MAG: hypothetical protein HXY37_10300 [Chloroflexi bacterium]|nr:hypothetical protein [Chloroflexota bacterium]